MRDNENIEPFFTDPARLTDRDDYIFINNPFLMSWKAELSDFDYNDDLEINI